MSNQDDKTRSYYFRILVELCESDIVSTHTFHCVSAAYFVVYGKGLYSKHMQDYSINKGIIYG